MTTATDAVLLANAAALAAGLQALTEAVRVGCPDPADAILLLLRLATFSPTSLNGSDSIGQAMTTVETATAAVCRRAALSSLARASADYQPDSYDDAVRIRTLVCGAINVELLISGSNHDFATYTALLNMRNAVVADLTARGADLAQTVDVERAVSLPAPVLAYQLYGDATRAAELVRRANPVGSLFMPRSFRALSS